MRMGLAALILICGSGFASAESDPMEAQRCIWRCGADTGMNQPAYNQCIASRCDGEPRAASQRKPRSETGQGARNSRDRVGQGGNSLQECNQTTSPELTIRGCTTLILGQGGGLVHATVYSQRGHAYLAKGELDKAIGDFDAAVRLDPGLAPARNGRGLVRAAKGDIGGAIADYDEAIRRDPTLVPVYSNRGNAWSAKGDKDRAIADYDEALRRDPGLASIYFNRANARFGKGDKDQAIADYNEAIRLSPGLALAYTGRGNALSTNGDTARAIADYSEAIRLDPSSAHAYHGRGVALSIRGDTARAIADYSEAIRLDPGFTHALNARGFAWSAQGDRERAIADYDAAIRLDPKFVVAYANRGRLALYGGKMTHALTDLVRAGELEPQDAHLALWLDIAQRRSNLQSSLPDAVERLDMMRWPAPVVTLYLGRSTPEAVIAAADHPDATVRRRQICEAVFYSGEFALRQGKRNDAMGLFRKAAETCPRDAVEHGTAVAALQAAGEQAPARIVEPAAAGIGPLAKGAEPPPAPKGSAQSSGALRILRSKQANAIVAASGLSAEAECAELHRSGQVRSVTRPKGSIESFQYVDRGGAAPYNVNVDVDHLNSGQRAEIASWLETVLVPGQNVAFGVRACGAAGRMLYLDTLEAAPEQPRPSLVLSAPTGPVSQAAPVAAAAVANSFYGLWGRTPADCAVASGDDAPEDQDGVDYLFIGERSKWGTFHYCRILNVSGSGRERTYRLRCNFEGEDKAVVVNDRFALSGRNGEFLHVGKAARKLTLCTRTTPRWISDASKRLLNVAEGQ